MSFLDHLQQNTNYTTTENGAKTHRSSLNANLDFFALAGAMRTNLGEAVSLFDKAYHTDQQTAVRTLFYLRDIRGGQGERDVFFACFNRLTEINPELAKALLTLIPEYGRWSDVVRVTTGDLIETTAQIIKTQLEADEAAMAEGKSVSLLAKWLPSENTSSKETKRQARQLAQFLELKPAQYRKRVVALRKYIKLLEQQMSANQWEAIDYEKLPSQAQRKHVKAFKRHDEKRYSQYLDKAQRGEAKMNTSTLYTYEVFDAVEAGSIDAANAMWANLPDYTNGANALVVADVSGSMFGRPISVSVSLALYFAEHNQGPFHNKFMTFSERPQLVEVKGSTLAQRLRNIQMANWGMNTNLEAVFDVILKSAIASGAKGDDMPKVLYIISDMEFDSCVRADETIFANAQQQFDAAGLSLPHVVFWNVEARNTQTPATKFDNRVTLLSGLSQSTFRYAVEGKTPEQLMDEVVNSERYAQIVV